MAAAAETFDPEARVTAGGTNGPESIGRLGSYSIKSSVWAEGGHLVMRANGNGETCILPSGIN